MPGLQLWALEDRLSDGLGEGALRVGLWQRHDGHELPPVVAKFTEAGIAPHVTAGIYIDLEVADCVVPLRVTEHRLRHDCRTNHSGRQPAWTVPQPRARSHAHASLTPRRRAIEPNSGGGGGPLPIQRSEPLHAIPYAFLALAVVLVSTRLWLFLGRLAVRAATPRPAVRVEDHPDSRRY